MKSMTVRQAARQTPLPENRRWQVLSPGWNPTQGGGTLRPVPALKEGDPGTENVFRPESGEEDERAE